MSVKSTAFDRCSDEALTQRLFELYDHPDEHAAEIAELDAAILARLAATYTPDPGHSPRRRIVA
jgi:hypothetical protein